MKIKEFTNHFDNVKSNGKDSYMATCPCHDDKHQSLCISENNGKILLNCFAGCATKDVLKAKGLTMKDLYNNNNSYVPPNVKSKTEYLYSTELKKVRNYKNGEKYFYWLHVDENGQWKKGIGGKDVPLYNQNVLSAGFGENEVVYIVEGEKDVDTLTMLGIKAVSSPNGASSGKLEGKWNDNYNELFKGLDVVIIPDNDDVGKAFADMVANKLLPIAKGVKVLDLTVEWDNLPPKGDITDAYNMTQPARNLSRETSFINKLKTLTADTAVIKAASVSTSSKTPPFIRFGKKGIPTVVVPLLAQYVRDNLKYLFVRGKGNQSLMIYVYNQGVYELCSEDVFKGHIKKFIENYDIELVKMNQVNEAYKNLSTDINCITQDQLIIREDIINFRNGLLIVGENELKFIEHTPEIFTTIQLPCNWIGHKVKTPVFSKYMKTLTNDDKDIARFLMEFIGVCISNVRGYRMKKALFLVGDGDTGKSQLKSLTEHLLGSGNYIGIDLSEIEARFGTGAIYDKRLAGSSDMSYATVSELKVFKRLTGGDSIFAEFKGQQGFEYVYYGLLWFCMNCLPKFGGDDGEWVFNRIMVVHCPNVIPPDKRDKQLLDKMISEIEGIVYLAVKALQRVIRSGYCFDEPESVNLARIQYMKENNTVLAFFDECMCERKTKSISHDDKVTTSLIYKIYKEWCKDNNHGFAKTMKEFRDTLAKKMGLPYSEITKTIGGHIYYIDYTLTYETKQAYRYIYGGD